MSGRVYAIAVSGSDVYAGGVFVEAGGVPANRIARWDGSSWHALGSGVNGRVNAIAVSGSDVYVGGYFTHAGGSPANCIAHWDGNAWHAMGAYVDNYVFATEAIDSGIVYVGGNFLCAGMAIVNYVARWVPDTGIEPSPGEASTSLHAAPNPAVAGTDLSFQSTGLSPLTLEIYDTSGRLVWMRDLGILPAGPHALFWDGCGAGGASLAPGVYFVRLHGAGNQAAAKVLLTR